MKQVFSIVLCMAASAIAGAQALLPLPSGLDNGSIKAEFKATGEFSGNVSSYYGECMRGTFYNTTDSSITLVLTPGFYLMPEKDELQRMIIVDEIQYVLAPNSREEHIFPVMCTEKYDGAPNRRSVYSFGEEAPGPVVDLANLLAEKNWFDFSGQKAMWAMHHHDLPLEFIHSGDPEKQTKLRYIVRQAREREGLPPIETREDRVAFAGIRVGEVPPSNREPVTLKRYRIRIEGDFDYSLQEPLVGTMQVFDEAGELRFTYFENQELPAGERHFRFNFQSITYDEDEEFYLRLTDANGNVVKEHRISQNTY